MGFNSEFKGLNILSRVLTVLVGLDFLTVEASRLHSDAPHSVELLWMSDQPEAQTSTCQHTLLTRDKYPCRGGIRNHIPTKRAAVDDARLRPRDHRRRQVYST